MAGSPALVQAAATCSSLGDNDHAFALIERALAVKNDRLVWLKVDPQFDNLRTDERYEGVLRRIEPS